MSQVEVYKVMLELGGSASRREILEVLAARFPEVGAAAYITRTLHRMQSQGYIKNESGDKWHIVPSNKPSWASSLSDK